MKCAEIEILLPSYLSGEETEMNAVIKEHLASCSECRAFTDLMNGLKSDLSSLTSMEPQAGYVSRIHDRIAASSETTTCEIVESANVENKKHISSKRTVAGKHSAKIIKLSFNEKVKDLFKVKLKTPAFWYSVAIHAAVLVLSITAFYSHKIITENKSPNDINWVRSQAYENVSHQVINASSINIKVLLENGPVYITESKLCLQIQITLPKHSSYQVYQVKNGTLQLPAAIAKKFFGSNTDISILNYENAIEVWSKPILEEYIRRLPVKLGGIG